MNAPETPSRCPTCRGSRVWRSTVGGGYNMKCPTCKGKGWLTPLELNARMQRDEAQAKKNATKATAWREANPAVCAWIDANQASNPFAAAMAMNLERFGSLTDNMRGSIERKLSAATAQTLPPAECNIPAIEASFARAKAQGIKFPKMGLERFTFKPASEKSTNPGAVYVTLGDRGLYLGKILSGRFMRSRDCDADTEAAIIATATDPKAAAVAYGKKYGRCAICSRELSDPASIALGIGPICAERMGW